MFLVSDLLSQGSNVVRHAVRGLADGVSGLRFTQSGCVTHSPALSVSDILSHGFNVV